MMQDDPEREGRCPICCRVTTLRFTYAGVLCVLCNYTHDPGEWGHIVLSRRSRLALSRRQMSELTGYAPDTIKKYEFGTPSRAYIQVSDEAVVRVTREREERKEREGARGFPTSGRLLAQRTSDPLPSDLARQTLQRAAGERYYLTSLYLVSILQTGRESARPHPTNAMKKHLTAAERYFLAQKQSELAAVMAKQFTRIVRLYKKAQAEGKDLSHPVAARWIEMGVERFLEESGTDFDLVEMMESQYVVPEDITSPALIDGGPALPDTSTDFFAPLSK